MVDRASKFRADVAGQLAEKEAAKLAALEQQRKDLVASMADLEIRCSIVGYFHHRSTDGAAMPGCCIFTQGVSAASHTVGQLGLPSRISSTIWCLPTSLLMVQQED